MLLVSTFLQMAGTVRDDALPLIWRLLTRLFVTYLPSASDFAIWRDSRSTPGAMQVCIDSRLRCSLKVSEVQGDIAAGPTAAGNRADLW